MVTPFLLREHTEKLYTYHTSINNLKLIRVKIIYLHTESFKEIQ